MYYQNYEDYMRSILGYPIERENTYNNQYNANLQLNSNDTFFENINNNLTEEEVADLYPEIYKILNPMVCKICDENRETLSKDLITRMTDEIYDNFEEKNEIISRITSVLEKYTNYSKVLVVTHGMVITALTDVQKPEHTQIVKYTLND